MDARKAEGIWKKLAKQRNVSEESVRSEMEAAIEEAMKNPETRAFWQSIPSKNERPTPEEVIACIAAMMQG